MINIKYWFLIPRPNIYMLVIIDFVMVIWRRVRRKLTLVCDSWFLGCNRGVCLNCTPVAFQHPLMRLRFLWFFVKYLLWFGAFLLGCNEGKVLPSYDIFHTSWVKPAPDAYQPKNTAAKTPLRAICQIARAQSDVVLARASPRGLVCSQWKFFRSKTYLFSGILSVI